jgi:uncharacterized protein (TIGR00106 family)
MHAMVDLCVVPIGADVSVSRYIAECERVIEAAGLHPELHPYGTIISGEWDDVFAAVRKCHERVHEMGVSRIFTTLKVGTRTDRKQTPSDKVDSVRRQLENDTKI